MSAASTPSGPPSGPPSTTLNTAAPVARRRPQASAFVSRKRPVVKKTVARPPQPTITAPSSQPTQNGAPVTSTPAPPTENLDDFKEFPIYVSKNELMQGLRHHVIKFLPKQDSNTNEAVIVNPFDERQFTRPVHLHRRMARDKAAVAEQENASGVDDKEREALAIKRAEREAEREATKAQIAPGTNEKQNSKRKNKHGPFTPFYYDDNPAAAKRAKLRHEEARPWHLEDFDRKNIWVGSYEEPLSEQTAMFIVEGDGFRMVPCERWYKFIPTNRVQAMGIDQVEKHMSRKTKVDRWMLKTQDANDEARRMRFQAQMEGRRQPMRGADDEDVQGLVKAEDGEFRGEVDEIDFEFGDEFQDDDEGNLYANSDNEDAKEISEKLRRDQLNANLPSTGIKNEDKDWDLEEEMEREAERQEKKRAKKLRKQLIKKERKYEYDSDSEHPYSSSEDSEDSDEEKERLEEERKREEAKKLANGDRSGASTKGTNTPTGRSEKRDLSRSNALLGASLKRPGSPNLSDASGNESRKKAKINGRASPPNGSGSLSPNAPRGAGSGSDTDTASRSGRPRIRLKASPSTSPRNGTPAASRSASPDTTGDKGIPTPDELKALVPPGGIGTAELMKRLKTRLPTKETRDTFFAMVRKICIWDRERKLILPKDA